MARTKQTARVHGVSFISLTNLNSNETVHQRSLLLKGRITATSDEQAPNGHVTITTTDPSGAEAFPKQAWPVSAGNFKALVLLSPGENVLHIDWNTTTSNPSETLTRTVTYVPLIQHPPLHLAIMVAKDSPLLMDCPPYKAGAEAKLRMAAYMWQAMTAEDMRLKGLGRRSFRLEEEWGLDTVSSSFQSAMHDLHFTTSSLSPSYTTPRADAPHRTTAKINIIRSDKTVAELRDPAVAQQNASVGERRKQDLYKWFLSALRSHGAPFTPHANAVVAGLILDSHYSPQQDLILAHAALGGRDEDARAGGIHLGVFGSHTCWAWPRFVEEVAVCLLDATPTDFSRVGDDNGDCGSAWEACCVGQGALLHEVGHAFGLSHTSGIMARGYPRDWAKHFVSRLAHSSSSRGRDDDLAPVVVVEGVTPNEARWDVRGALALRCLPHFRIPGDGVLSAHAFAASPTVGVVAHDGEGGGLRLRIGCPAGLASVAFRGKAEEVPSIAVPVESREYSCEELEALFGREEAVDLAVVGMNGKEKVVSNVWSLFGRLSFLRVPGSDLVLQKRSVKSESLERHEDDDDYKYWEWAALLTVRSADGKLAHAHDFDMRVGCILDGGVLYYEDGQRTNLGPRVTQSGGHHQFGGHASQRIPVHQTRPIKKIELNRSNSMVGIRTTLADGTVRGALNDNYHDNDIHILEPAPGERVVGFFGRSDWDRGFNGIQEFGIITAPEDAVLPDAVYDMPELKNMDGGGIWKGGESGCLKRRFRDDDEEEKGSDEEDVDGEWHDDDDY